MLTEYEPDSFLVIEPGVASAYPGSVASALSQSGTRGRVELVAVKFKVAILPP